MEWNIRIAGAAGQGMQTIADSFGMLLCRMGYHVYSHTDAESRIRGGLNFSQLRCSDRPAHGYVDRVDVLVALSEPAVQEFGPKVGEHGMVIVSGKWDHPFRAPFSLDALAATAGSPKAAGTVAVAALGTLFGASREEIQKSLRHIRMDDSAQKAIDLGIQAVRDWKAEGRMGRPLDRTAERMWIAGHEAIALGALAGGVRYVAGYPMSPASGTLTALARWSHETGTVFDQAEDEVAAINMVAAASYAGARSMTATSGGGFCLMTEGVSLLGMIESPAVIVLAQRPGPATGLPTKTAQGDLKLALHAGHGFFPRIILAPKNISDCYPVTARAFDLAEKYQVPVFVLTDQMLQDGQAVVERFSVAGLNSGRHLLSTEELARMPAYRRYEQTANGISPMAAPGVSSHVVVADSDEHDEEGHLTESAEIAERMAKKRLMKAKTVAAEARLPEIEGKKDAEVCVVSWGSTYETLKEVREALAARGKHFAHLHFTQLWPLPVDDLRAALGKSRRLVAVEANVVSELGSLISETTQRRIDVTLNRYDGRPFEVAELVARFEQEVFG